MAVCSSTGNKGADGVTSVTVQDFRGTGYMSQQTLENMSGIWLNTLAWMHLANGVQFPGYAHVMKCGLSWDMFEKATWNNHV